MHRLVGSLFAQVWRVVAQRAAAQRPGQQPTVQACVEFDVVKGGGPAVLQQAKIQQVIEPQQPVDVLVAGPDFA